MLSSEKKNGRGTHANAATEFGLFIITRKCLVGNSIGYCTNMWESRGVN